MLFAVSFKKVSDVLRETKDGFTKGQLIIEGISGYQEEEIIVYFQNEYLVAKRKRPNVNNLSPSNIDGLDIASDPKSEDGTELNAEILATAPDLITLVETETGEPIQSSNMKYGLRVSVLVLPAPPLMNSEAALLFVGPEAFGFDGLTYNPVGNYKEYESIAKC